MVKKMIPILVLWAKHSWQEIHTYKNLQEAICIENTTWRLGAQLGYIDDIFKNISKEIPTLNALVCNDSTKLPSNGLKYVFKNYDSWKPEKKRLFVQAQNKRAHDYDYSWVLRKLELELPTVIEEKELESTRSKMQKFFPGGEGELHKKLKEYIFKNPASIGILDTLAKKTEYSLLSGDKLDIKIETQDTIWAIEVKSIISDETDMLRGIYQCVKYRAVLEAEKAVEPSHKAIKTLLVLGGELSRKLKLVANILGVEYKDNFSTPF